MKNLLGCGEAGYSTRTEPSPSGRGFRGRFQGALNVRQVVSSGLTVGVVATRGSLVGPSVMIENTPTSDPRVATTPTAGCYSTDPLTLRSSWGASLPG